MIFTYVVVFFEVGFVRIMDLTVVVVHKTAPIFFCKSGGGGVI